MKKKYSRQLVRALNHNKLTLSELLAMERADALRLPEVGPKTIRDALEAVGMKETIVRTIVSM